MVIKKESTPGKQPFDARERAEIQQKFDIRAVVRHLIADGSVDIGYEREISEEALKREGKKATLGDHGFYVPDCVLGNRTAMSVTGSAGLVATDTLAGEFIGPLQAKLALSKLGVRFLDGLVGDVVIPKGDAIESYWITTEGGDATEQTPTVSQVTATPKTCGVYVDVTRKLLTQTSEDAKQLVNDLILSAVARGIETAAINGSGSSGQPLGLVNVSGITEIDGITPGSPTRANLLSFISAIEGENVDTEFMKWLAPSAVKAKLAGTYDINTISAGEGVNVVVGSKTLYSGGYCEEYPLVMSNLVPAGKLILGAWRDMMLLRWGRGIELTADRYSLSKSGGLRIVAFADCDVVVRHPEAFAVGTILSA